MTPDVDIRGSHDDESSTILGRPSERYSQSLKRGLDILEYFTPERPQLGIAQIADSLQMSRPTTHRYVSTLVALGFLEQGSSRKYRLGQRVTDLGMSALNSMGLREHSRSPLKKLCQQAGHTASLAVLYGTEILYVDRVRSFRKGQYEIDHNIRLASQLPAYCTSMGKVLLAGLSEPAQRELLGRMRLTRSGPNTITSKKALRAELEHVFEEGMAVNNEELAAGSISIAAPIRARNRQVVAAINLAANTSTITLEEMIEKLSPYLLAAADNISARLGYRREDEVVR
jgi:IclR family transcriptional regulator, pca regulon regulatory protein